MVAFDAVNARYRGYIPARELARRGHDVFYEAGTRPPKDLARLKGCDAVLFHRHYTPEFRRLASLLRDEGVGILWDNDDRLSGFGRDHPAYRRLGALRGVANDAHIRAMIRLADVVTTTTEPLAAAYAAAGAPSVRVVENYLPPEFVSVARPSHDGVVVGWVAAIEHRSDREQLGIDAVLDRVLAAHPDVRVQSIGVKLGLPASRYTHIEVVDFARLTAALAELDIGLAPIAETDFNLARSNVKLKEYAAAGVVWAASARGPYVGHGEQEGGVLVDDGDWEDALGRLIVDARRRRKLAKRAVRWAKGQVIGRHVQRWEAAFEEAIQSAARRSDAAGLVV